MDTLERATHHPKRDPRPVKTPSQPQLFPKGEKIVTIPSKNSNLPSTFTYRNNEGCSHARHRHKSKQLRGRKEKKKMIGWVFSFFSPFFYSEKTLHIAKWISFGKRVPKRKERERKKHPFFFLLSSLLSFANTKKIQIKISSPEMFSYSIYNINARNQSQATDKQTKELIFPFVLFFFVLCVLQHYGSFMESKPLRIAPENKGPNWSE